MRHANFDRAFLAPRLPKELAGRTKQAIPSRLACFTSLEAALARIGLMAGRGYQALMSEAEAAFIAATGATSASIVHNSAGAWYRWDELDMPGIASDLVVPATAAAAARCPFPIRDGLFVPIRPSVVGAHLVDPRDGKETECIAGIVAAAVGLALTAVERKRAVTGEDDELDVMQRVALRILKSSELQEIFSLITHETRRLLGSDICGIMLREGDAVVMQRCVGNFSPATASLRMAAGQGVAGRVVATKQPCCIENYVGSTIISRDFMSLARDEMVRSALAAPLLSGDDVIGVLEVWRRQTTTFDEHDTQRLVALANLTSLAIENARLAQARQTMVEELAQTNRALTERFEVIRSSAAFQNELIRLQLEGRNLAHVAAKAAEHLRASVLILDATLAIEGACPERTELDDEIRTALKAGIKTLKHAPAQAVSQRLGDNTLLLRSANAGAETLGYVALICTDPDAGVELALSQICTAASLHLSERRAAGRARAENLSGVLWDLLEGSEEVRRFALARARDLHVDLDGPQRVYLCKLGGIEQYAANEGWSVNDLSVSRRQIAFAYRDVPGFGNAPKLAGMRGNTLAMIWGGCAVSAADRLGNDLANAIAARVPGLCVHLGVSAPCAGSGGLAAAFREAQISIEVARQRGRTAAATYEDAGIVGLLLSLRDDADVRKLVRTIFGSLLDQKPVDRKRLLDTLMVFFEENCSRTAAAQRLDVHEKTIAYRLAKIRELTGLDFSKHEKRLLADIALRMHALTSTAEATGEPATP